MLQTVYRVLNDSERVTPETRERVRAAIDALGYRRNSVARALVTRKSGILGIITTSSWHYGPTSTYTDNESGKIDRKNNVKMLEKYFNKLSQSCLKPLKHSWFLHFRCLHF